DGRKVATRSDNEVRIWDMRSGKMLRRISGKGFIPGLRWSRDGKHVVVASANDLNWWNVSTGRLTRTEPLPSGWIQRANLLPCGTRASCTFIDKGSLHTVILHLTQRGARIYSAPIDHDIRISPDGRRV